MQTGLIGYTVERKTIIRWRSKDPEIDERLIFNTTKEIFSGRDYFVFPVGSILINEKYNFKEKITEVDVRINEVGKGIVKYLCEKETIYINFEKVITDKKLGIDILSIKGETWAEKADTVRSSFFVGEEGRKRLNRFKIK